MNRVCCSLIVGRLALIAALFSASPASGQPGLNLSWSACGAAGAGSAVFGCDSNDSEPFMIVGSLNITAVGPPIYSVTSSIDILTGESVLPNWWELGGSGACRGDAASASIRIEQEAGCVELYPPDFGLASIESIQRLALNRLRITISSRPTSPPTIPEGPDPAEYGLFTLRIARSSTVGAGSCPGCQEHVCIVYGSAVLTGPAPYTEVVTAPFERNVISWQSGDCTTTPVRNVTWGRLRAMYR